MGMQRADVQGRFSTMLDNFSTMRCDVTLAECDHQCVFFFSVYILFQSTHSLRSATFVADNPMRTLEPVSIHALLAECDLQKWHDNPPMVRFNPRTPCGVRLEPRPMPKVNLGFNPRTPCGVRLPSRNTASGKYSSFNPRTPCGVRLRPTLYIATQQSKSYFAPTSLKRPSLHGCSF